MSADPDWTSIEASDEVKELLRDFLTNREEMSIRSGEAVHCDDCGGEIEPGDITAHYGSTLDMYDMSADGVLTLQRHYCEECDREEVTFPTKEALEVIVRHKVADDYHITNLEVADVSRKGEGIPWDPDEVRTEVLEMSSKELAGPGSGAGPEDIVDLFALYGIPFDFVVDAHGSVHGESRIQSISAQIDEIQGELRRINGPEFVEWAREQPYPATGTISLPSSGV